MSKEEEAEKAVILGLSAVAAVAIIALVADADHSAKEQPVSRNENLLPQRPIPKQLEVLNRRGGFAFGRGRPSKECPKARSPKCPEPAFYGKPIDEDGNILIIGGPGSGKTTGNIYPTIETWKDGSMVLIDAKGDMADVWREIHARDGKTLQLFAPLKNGSGTCTYDPFVIMRQDPKNAAGHASDLAEAIIPITVSEREPVWKKSAQAVLASAFLWGFHKGKTFIETIQWFASPSVSELVRIITSSGDMQAKFFISKFQGASTKTAASIGVELYDLAKFVLNKQVISSLTPSADRPMLDWGTLNTSTQAVDTIIDVSGPALSQCTPLVRLMVTQLIKSLSLRPQRSYPKDTLPPMLICIDEFPQLERIPAIMTALTTLRSRGVTMALCVQSLASLDATYGHDEAKVIFDACSYKVIRSVSDVESQEYISKAIGSVDVETKTPSFSLSIPLALGTSVSYNRQTRPLVYPEELGRLKDPVLITPYGPCQVPDETKYRNHSSQVQEAHPPVALVESTSREVMLEQTSVSPSASNNMPTLPLPELPLDYEDALRPDEAAKIQKQMDDIGVFCLEPRSAKEIMAFIGLKARPYFREQVLNPLLKQGRLQMTYPETPKHPRQRYYAVNTDQ